MVNGGGLVPHARTWHGKGHETKLSVALSIDKKKKEIVWWGRNRSACGMDGVEVEIYSWVRSRLALGLLGPSSLGPSSGAVAVALADSSRRVRSALCLVA